MNAAAGERCRAWAAAGIGRLHRAAYLLCGNWHEAEEIVQEALARTFVHWGRIEGMSNADAYVRKILVNETRSRWRRHRTQRSLESLSASVSDGADERAAHS